MKREKRNIVKITNPLPESEWCCRHDMKMERQLDKERPEQGEVGRALGEAVLSGVGAVLLQQD